MTIVLFYITVTGLIFSAIAYFTENINFKEEQANEQSRTFKERIHY